MAYADFDLKTACERFGLTIDERQGIPGLTGNTCRRSTGFRLQLPRFGLLQHDEFALIHSTVTDLARLRGWSTSQPRQVAMW